MNTIFWSGVITCGYFVCAIFFLRFWARTKDTLFLSFCCAFALLAMNQALVAFSGLEREERSWFYLLRLVAFLLVITALVQKNVVGKK